MTDKIFDGVLLLLEAMIAWNYFNSLFEAKLEWKSRLALLVGGYGICYIAFLLFMILVWNIVVFAVVNAGILALGYEVSGKQVFYHTFFLTAAMSVADLVAVLIMGLVFQDYTEYQEIFTVYVLLAAVSKLVYFVLSECAVHIFSGRKETFGKRRWSGVLLGMIPVTSLFIILVFMYVALYLDPADQLGGAMLVCSCLLVVMNVAAFLVYHYSWEQEEHNYALRLQAAREKIDEEYYRRLEQNHENQRIVIHDIRSHLQVIRNLTETESGASVREYIDTIEQSAALRTRVKYCKNQALNVLLQSCEEACGRCRISLKVEISDNRIERMSWPDVVSVFGNLLDNARQGTEGSADAWIDFRIFPAGQENATVITVTNSCAIAPEPDGKGGFRSSKKEKEYHGYGLKSVSEVLKKYHAEQKMYYDSENEEFHVILMLVWRKESETDR